MNRRAALRNVVIISIGAGLLPSCKQEDKSSFPLKNISLSGQQEKMLIALTEAIIPQTKNFIGAKDLKAHEFVLTMLDDCTSPEDQLNFQGGMKGFDKLCHEKFGQIFTGFTAKQKTELLLDIEKKKDIPADSLMFYETVKRYTLLCFTTSRDYMVNIRKYNMVPGPNFRGCVPVAN